MDTVADTGDGSRTYLDLLSPTATDPQGAGIEWTPASTDGPVAGVLLVKQKRIYTSYAVVEFASDWSNGRAFHLAKLTEGSDASEEAYDVFVSGDPRACRCDCRGWAYGRGKPCKHLAALSLLLKAGQL